MIRMDMAELRVMGRATQGVKLIRLDEGDEIADITVVADDEKAVIVENTDFTAGSGGEIEPIIEPEDKNTPDSDFKGEFDTGLS